MVSPDQIRTATLATIDSMLKLAKAQYERSKRARQKFGSRSTLYGITHATKELEMVQQRKQELLEKKSWMSF